MRPVDKITMDFRIAKDDLLPIGTNSVSLHAIRLSDVPETQLKFPLSFGYATSRFDATEETMIHSGWGRRFNQGST